MARGVKGEPWIETFNRMVEHYATLAMTPGWWAYAQQQVISLESEQSGAWQGLRESVRERIVAAGYRPRPDERGSWWEIPSKLGLENLGRRRW